MQRSPVTAIFMPVVQHGFDLFQTTVKPPAIHRFLSEVQQQAAQTNQAQIASFSVAIAVIAPWAVLAALGQRHQRHFYYDPPQAPAMVGLDVVVECVAAGKSRFAQAQAFVQDWQGRFLCAEVGERDRPNHFFCSATFFDAATATSAPAYFEPMYVFVPKVQVMAGKVSSRVTFNRLVTATTDIPQTVAQIDWQLKQLRAMASLGMAQPASRKVMTKGVAKFEVAVTAVLRQMQAKELHKVVLADVMDVVAPQAIDGVRSLQTLRQNHPDCTVFSVGNGKGQAFIGASPERLLSISQGQLTTDALAGSASRGQTPDADAQIAQALLHSDKERYEHQVVVDFIVEQLRSLHLTPHYSPTPHLLQLLHIQHLHTTITAQIKSAPLSGDLSSGRSGEISLKISPLEILAKLHPTPAVAGVPREAACRLIRQHESFDRTLYAAPLGWIDTEGNSEFVVGIRSALINGCEARLYAGAGIVAGSEPAKELAEIKLKLQTLLNALV